MTKLYPITDREECRWAAEHLPAFPGAVKDPGIANNKSSKDGNEYSEEWNGSTRPAQPSPAASARLSLQVTFLFSLTSPKLALNSCLRFPTAGTQAYATVPNLFNATGTFKHCLFIQMFYKSLLSAYHMPERSIKGRKIIKLAFFTNEQASKYSTKIQVVLILQSKLQM